MDQQLLELLSTVTAEERAILDGRTTIDRDLYMEGTGDVVNAQKLLSDGKLITLRTHTRFIRFPEHTHDYVEVVYMCAGVTTHIVNGQTVTLEPGELLFLSQSARHTVERAGEGDVAVNFIVLPEFFNTALSVLGEEETPLRRFLVDCLCGQDTGPGCLHFRVSGVKQVQNLVENLLWTLIRPPHNKRRMSQMTMALLFLQLVEQSDTLDSMDQEEAAVLKVLRYVESNYADGSLTAAAEQLHYDLSWLSREVKRRTGKTYTQIVQEKRLAQAAFLLRNTDRNVADIAAAVGYENVSFFHRVFFSAFGCTPRTYRLTR